MYAIVLHQQFKPFTTEKNKDIWIHVQPNHLLQISEAQATCMMSLALPSLELGHRFEGLFDVTFFELSEISM